MGLLFGKWDPICRKSLEKRFFFGPQRPIWPIVVSWRSGLDDPTSPNGRWEKASEYSRREPVLTLRPLKEPYISNVEHHAVPLDSIMLPCLWPPHTVLEVYEMVIQDQRCSTILCRMLQDPFQF